ncbi:unnamed protein product, partial [Heterosigma akashiwo]
AAASKKQKGLKKGKGFSTVFTIASPQTSLDGLTKGLPQKGAISHPIKLVKDSTTSREKMGGQLEEAVRNGQKELEKRKDIESAGSEHGDEQERRRSSVISIDGNEADKLTKLKYTTFVVRRPFLTQAITLSVVILCAVVLVVGNIFQFNDQSENDYLIMSDRRVVAKNTLDEAYKAVGGSSSSANASSSAEARQSVTSAAHQLQQHLLYSLTYNIFSRQDKSGGANMLTEAGLAVMEAVEAAAMGAAGDDYVFEDFCLYDEAN